MNYKKVGIIGIISLTIICSCVFLLLNNTSSKDKKDQNAKQQITTEYQEIAESIDETTDTTNVVKRYQQEFNNTDIIGELSIENTNMRVPVAQSTDNDYYLNHLLDKSRNSLGSVYLDYRNHTTDRKIIIYGHNSENVYTEFNLLENYLDESYYNNHSKIYFQTEDASYQYQIFSIYIATDDFQHVNLNYNTEEYANHLIWLKDQSVYNTGVEVNRYDDILILQTCYFNPEDTFLIVAAKKINSTNQ